jgi:hypothetical protein
MYQTKTTVSGYALNSPTNILKTGAGLREKNSRAFHETDGSELEFAL